MVLPQFTSRGMSAEASFLKAFEAASPGTHANVFDVGANNGRWTSQWETAMREAPKRGQSLSVFFFEPQPVFKESLMQLATRMNATFLPLAVGRRAGMVEMIGKVGSVSTHAEEIREEDTTSHKKTLVPMVDFAAFLRDKLSGGGRYNFLKLDVEGMEYTLLPWLLAHSHVTLCRLHSMLIEWHLNYVALPHRLDAYALELSFLSQLRLGCPDDLAPVGVWMEKYPTNNFDQPIPGLLENSLIHAKWEGWSRRKRQDTGKREVANLAAQASATTNMAANAACSTRRVACHTSSTGFHEDNCMFDRITCDPRLAYSTYLRALNHPVNTTGTGECAAGLPMPPWKLNALN
mmetsp:Transcript_14581/g.40848  ORF Transcript_14581/g.40848 Transcript_14581/m.40848 type:complete len:348 (-) Transcript_14581:242-1285(-)